MRRYDERFQRAIEQLVEGSIDHGVDMWETTFREAEHYLSVTQLLWRKAEYAQVLQAVDLHDRSKEVDREIAEALENDEIEGHEEVSCQDRSDLLENIARRWDLPVGSDEFHENVVQGLRIDILESTSREEDASSPVAIPSVRRTQSFSTPPEPALMVDDSIRKGNQASSLEQRITGDIIFSSYQGSATEGPLGVDLKTDPSRAQWWFARLEESTHNFVYGKDSKFFGKSIDGKPYERVRIAVLDSGIAHTKSTDKKALKKYWDRVKGFASFIDSERPTDALNDESGHGTGVAVQLMKTCPTAEIYICRVVRKVGDESVVEKSAVEKAICESIDKKKWAVDIINMSFGWNYNDHPGVRKAIALAKAQGVLLFASTSNDGVTTPNDILYPALADEVISVDAADGNGEPASFNPSSVLVPGKERFTAPGIGLPTPISEHLLDGTSFASPIAAGVAGLVLEFARQYPLAGSPSVLSCLRERHGMVLMLRRMSKQKGVDQFNFLCPWELLGDVWGVFGGEGQPGSKRYFVAQEIVYRLRNGFGETVGAEIFPII